jgi:hypothetical protein
VVAPPALRAQMLVFARSIAALAEEKAGFPPAPA